VIESPSAPDVRNAHSFQRHRALLAAVAAVVLVLAGAWWWTHPDLFEDHGGGFKAEPAQVESATLTVGVTSGVENAASQSVTFQDARIRLAENSAPADARFSLCLPRAGEGTVISVKGDLSDYCGEVRPLVPGSRLQVSRPPGSEYVVVTLTPTGPGVVRLVGVDLDYSLGWRGQFRRGTDSVAMSTTIEAR
jgi:hypothetical protein